MELSIELARTVLAVVDLGTFDAAARRLRVTPSAVSQRVRALEHQLGQVLLVREKPVRPTPAGRTIVRLARQLALLEQEARAELGAGDTGVAIVTVAVNADSLATWLMPALGPLFRTDDLVVQVHRDDQNRTAELLESGDAMAAVTARAAAVAGCVVRALGSMRYRAVATPAYVARHGGGPGIDWLRDAPLVQFDRHDDLQHRYLRACGVDPDEPPRHVIPSSTEFAAAVHLGAGWGMLPDAQCDAALSDGRLVLIGGDPIEVELYWQQWSLRSSSLDRVADAVETGARAALRPAA
ncbi:LysR family transcriptional regulator ArgP [Microcella frigidaquae]|uniref:LysR family transcriptional regulator (Chromosome initiation inhibitor) n=1 Tax=Microcella frigidaquae TaxID=424758 RepID=A0A840X708_9MICO|nr:LysR family transcriptional regulator ArgP [Microcella frigidaquae]MBB5618333.1 LysR family transcriptional regulator (chromosome initiation inhibitor) [Microcella frigidaquae]NHN44761.1 LysR family transcriptional regulator ArgP [Microcella frigidaquae]